MLAGALGCFCVALLRSAKKRNTRNNVCGSLSFTHFIPLPPLYVFVDDNIFIVYFKMQTLLRSSNRAKTHARETKGVCACWCACCKQCKNMMTTNGLDPTASMLLYDLRFEDRSESDEAGDVGKGEGGLFIQRTPPRFLPLCIPLSRSKHMRFPYGRGTLAQFLDNVVIYFWTLLFQPPPQCSSFNHVWMLKTRIARS